MEEILRVEGLSKHYGSTRAVNNLSFTVEKGAVFAILGPNGSGKSTLLGMLTKLIKPTSGRWQWFGTNSKNTSLKEISVVLDRPFFYSYLTAYQNLKLSCKIKKVNPGKINEKLEIVDLQHIKNLKFSNLSYGMKQRLAIANALLGEPEVIILDEPTNGLDPKGIRDVRGLIQFMYSQGVTVILTSHILDEVEKVCNRVLVLQKGEKIFCGAIPELSRSKEYFIVKSASLDLLKDKIKAFNGVDNILEKDDFLIVNLKGEMDEVSFHKQIIESGVVLTHFEKMQHSLERRFLKLLDENNSYS